MTWTTDFSPETVLQDLHHPDRPHILEPKLASAVAAYVNNPRQWRFAPVTGWRGTRDESYDIAVNYALIYQRSVRAYFGVTRAKRAMADWRSLAAGYRLQHPNIPKDEWVMAVDLVCRDARRRFGAELRAAELSPRAGRSR